MNNEETRKKIAAIVDDNTVEAMVKRAEDNYIFKPDGVDIKQLAFILNRWQLSTGISQKETKNLTLAMASLVAAACGYDALCAGVNQSIGNAFKEEGQDTVFLNPR